jgi:ATP-dependent Clp protease ATP-binding subunit ClpC
MSELEDNNPNPNGGNNNQQQEEKKRPEKSKTPMLDTFGRDLTKLASEGKIEPVIGREKEIDRVIQILSRKKKNNPILVGEPGTGKSTIALGLAKKIFDKKVSRILHNKRVVELDLGLIVAGTKYRGQFEERMKGLLTEIEENVDLILFIDEVHTLLGSGNSSGAMDGANMFKPALARGTMQLIGATTFAEYKNSIEKDGALERRFQKVSVEEPSKKEVLEMLYQIKGMYEDFHNVTYTDEAIKSSVEFADRYINGRFFPDKAIDVIDEVGSRAHIDNMKTPEDVIKIEKKMEELNEKKQKFVKQQKYEDAAKMRDEERKILLELEAKKKEWENEEKKNRVKVTEEDVAKVIANMTGIPASKITQKEGEKLLKLPSELRLSVIGQDEAVDKVAEAIQISRAGLNNPKKPISSFLFLGPTGVGKTSLVKKLAKEMFNDEEAMIRLDMSEFTMPHEVSKIVGSPPGFVGYSERNGFTDKVREKNYCIILLDEIEKAHKDCLRPFLQVLDEGHMKDAENRKINFKNTIIVMTSNIGTKELASYKKVGFETNESEVDDKKSVIEKALKKTLPPEFINRIDEIVYFNSLSKDNAKEIVDIEVNKFIEQIKAEGYDVQVTEKVKDIILEDGFSTEYGARPIQRMVRQYLQKPLSLSILSGKAKKATEGKVKIDWNEEKKEITVK